MCVCVYVCVCVCVCIHASAVFVSSLISDDKCPNKEGLLAISNILDTCWKRLVILFLPITWCSLYILLFSKDATLTDIVLNILSDYYKSSDHSADARIAVLELIEQVNTIIVQTLVAPPSYCRPTLYHLRT